MKNFKFTVFNHKTIQFSTGFSGYSKLNGVCLFKFLPALFHSIIPAFKGLYIRLTRTLLKRHAGDNFSSIFYFIDQQSISSAVAFDNFFICTCNKIVSR